MRFGTWRGVTLAIALTASLTAGRSARANDPFHHTIPREVDAIDLNTGGPYYAPPIPYGHYAKGGHLDKAMGLFHGLGAGLCKGCGGLGKGCKHCGGSGLCGKGLCGGHGLGLGFGHGGDSGCGEGGCGGLFGHGNRLKDCGLCGGKGCGVCTSTIMASSQAMPPAPIPTPQGAVNAHCGTKGCGLGFGHKHNRGGSIFGDSGAACHHGPGMKCGNCLGGLGGLGKGCGACGGKGCGLCLGGLGGLGGKAHGLLNGLLHPHAGKIEWFVGPGGPVPLTPGYVPYVNPVRSPRDFFSFPPFTQ